MDKLKEFMGGVFLPARLLVVLIVIVAMMVAGYLLPFLYELAVLLVWGTAALTLIDLLLLYGAREGIQATRIVAERFSNGDINPVNVSVENNYRFPVRATLIDELPEQFQIRDSKHHFSLSTGAMRTIRYELRPTKRGDYGFGRSMIYVTSPIGLVQRRYIGASEQNVVTYPSFLQMRRYELLAISNRLSEVGVKKVRRLGHSMEFDQIRQYVPGDDYRTINWKATARATELMVNHFQDERSQHVYAVIDKGRTMKSPFRGMTLLDYAINASLVISNIAMLKYDKAGLLTFNDGTDAFLKPDRGGKHLNRILEVLYNQTTTFRESNFELLFTMTRRSIHQRSLILLFTNFDTVSSMRRSLDKLRAIARNHVLVVIFFDNTELLDVLEGETETVAEAYTKIIAEQFAFEKREIVAELERHGIHAVLSAPENLTVDTINSYLRLKSRGII